MLLAESLEKMDRTRLAHALGTAEECGGALERTMLRGHRGKSLEQRLQSRPVIKGMLAGGAIASLRLGELPLALLPMGLCSGHQEIATGP